MLDIKIDDKTGGIKFSLGNDDIAHAREIYAMMQTPGWKILQNYFAVARETLIDFGKDTGKSRAKKEMAAEKWAVLKGFDDCMTLPGRIVLRAEQYVAEKTKIKEDEHDGTNDGE